MNYQYHITINPIEGQAIAAFDTLCNQWGGKSILIQLPCGDFVEQPMLSLTINRDFNLQEAITDAKRFAEGIHQQGYVVRRVKIEIPAWEYGNVDVKDFIPYFEWHCLVAYSQDQHLQDVCKQHSLHISKNAIVDNKRYLTLREWGQYAVYLAKIQEARDHLKLIDVCIEKEKSEYCVYDNNTLIDKGWAE